jgi:hypothetical protein
MTPCFSYEFAWGPQTQSVLGPFSEASRRTRIHREGSRQLQRILRSSFFLDGVGSVSCPLSSLLVSVSLLVPSSLSLSLSLSLPWLSQCQASCHGDHIRRSYPRSCRSFSPLRSRCSSGGRLRSPRHPHTGEQADLTPPVASLSPIPTPPPTGEQVDLPPPVSSRLFHRCGVELLLLVLRWI